MSENVTSRTFGTWYGQNRLLAIPITFLLCFGLCGGCVGMFYIGGINMVRRDPLHIAIMEEVRSNQPLMDILGQPVQGGVFLGESKFEITEQGGTADCVIMVEGSRAEARILTIAELIQEKWTLQKVVASIPDTGQVITLLEDEQSSN